ncbi:MAG: hypothetical protein A2X86_21670 [Bdellovibrionales bacterium GWA2_49_15]|nr:MAG: hypothetical protein A2X86_21670 [Bdellovibrionales bacterium GWA2_49_15]HAZ11576.1 hypothetical protein [Bdellovibrionales bacterium]
MKSPQHNSFLARLATLLVRTKDETALLEHNYYVVWRLFIATIMLVGFGLIYFPSLYRAMGPNLQYLPDVVLRAEKWHTIYETVPGSCAEDTSDFSSCPANYHNPALWKSPSNRGDDAHPARVRERIGKDFWIGVELTSDIKYLAMGKMANRLVIGWFNASYRIWIDGQLIMSGNGWYETEPVVLTLSREQLSTERPIRIAIQIFHDGGTLNPDTMNEGNKEGLYSAHGFDDYTRVVMLMLRTRPFILFATYVVFALTCILFWLPSRRKPEYFYLGFYTLICGFNQARLFDLYWSGVNVSTYQTTAFFLLFIEFGMAMILGLAFARLRERYIAGAFFLVFAVPLACVWLANSNADLQMLKELARDWAAPTFSLIGALVCLTQAWYLRRQGSTHKARSSQLVIFAALLVVMGVFEGKLWWFEDGIFKLVWKGGEHLLLLFLIGGIILRDFRQQAKKAATNPVSAYHLREIAPEKLSGVVVVARLCSQQEEAMDSKVDRDSEGQIWRSHFFNAVLRMKGTVIEHKKELLVAFFDEDQCPIPIRSAIAAMEYLEMTTVASASMLFEFSGRKHTTSFRASIGVGHIRPTWEDVGGTREPNWEEAGDSTPFVIAARLFEMEEQVLPAGAEGENSSFVFMLTEACEELVRQDSEARRHVIAHDIPAYDKHKQSYQVSVYRPGKKTTIDQVA